MSDSMMWKIDRIFDPLRKEILDHAQTRVPKYRWLRKQTLDQAKTSYIQELSLGVPERWIGALCDARIKIAEEYGDDWAVEHLFNLREEAEKQLEIAWAKVGTCPIWATTAAQGQETIPQDRP
jgi:hypothetical protein